MATSELDLFVASFRQAWNRFSYFEFLKEEDTDKLKEILALAIEIRTGEVPPNA